jgi:hypothetical protein
MLLQCILGQALQVDEEKEFSNAYFRYHLFFCVLKPTDFLRIYITGLFFKTIQIDHPKMFHLSIPFMNCSRTF